MKALNKSTVLHGWRSAGRDALGKKKESKPARKLANQMGGRASYFLTIQFAIQLCSIQLKTHPRDYFLRLKRLSKKQNFLFLLAEIKLSWNVPILNWRMSFPPRRKWPMTLQHHSKIKVKRQTKLLGQPTSAWKKEGTWACKWANSIANKGSMIDFKTDIIL